ncbi:MAG: MBL fold metallo-hydrolase [Bacilli bacterium]|nr:MBL fold metallo-hydrolase [Bacilli bacterium]
MKSRIFNFVKTIAILLFLFGIVYILDNINDYKDIFKKSSSNISSVDNNSLLNIYFIDVGEGDCILIQENDSNILIDAGNNKDGPKIVDYIKELGIKNFKYVFSTHPHEDHIGGMDDIIKNFEIEHFVIPNMELNTTTYKEVIHLIEEKNIDKIIPKIDDEYEINKIQLKVLWVGEDLEEINRDSLVLKMNYYNTNYLFMADATKDTEQMILEKDLKCNVLKVAHHGSNWSTSAQFLEKAHPEYSIISVGKNNDYNFPKQVTLDKLNRINSTILRTDIDGTIKITSNGERIEYDTFYTDTNRE